MGWTIQGYFGGRPETDYGNGDEELEIDLRNEQVPTGIMELSIYYGCTGAEFFRGFFQGDSHEAKAAVHKVRMLTVYARKYGGVCRLDEHVANLVFHEHSDGRTYFFDAKNRPRDWKQAVEALLPVHDATGMHPDPQALG